MQLKSAAQPSTMIGLNTRHTDCSMMSKVYPALLKRLTIRLKRSEKFGFPMIFLNLYTKSPGRPGTEALRTQIQPSKPKRELTKITNSQNTKRTYCHPSEQLFPKRWPLSNPSRTKNNMSTHKVKRHRNSYTKNRQQRTTTELQPWNGQ